jgi:hypothetical protein
LKKEGEKQKWGQTRRLAFIEMRTQYEGRINRGDLVKFFGISTPQASSDLSIYQHKAPANLIYDLREKVYLTRPGFKPIFGRTSATHYLDELRRLTSDIVERTESFVGYVPSTGIVDTPARAIGAKEVATIVQAIRDRAALRVRYQSMEHPEAQDLTLSPHALGFDGLRWHIRAWCHLRAIFRDFAIGRMVVAGRDEHAPSIDASSDRGWTTKVPVILKPHPKLSPAQRQVVSRDYGMTKGQVVLKCRQAMLFYTLRHLRLEKLTVSDRPAEQHVIVHNAAEVQRWIDEDRAGNTAPMPGPARSAVRGDSRGSRRT